MKKILFRRKLFSYLERLNEQDLIQLEHYLNSPFFPVTNRRRVIILFKYLRKQHPYYHNNPKTENEVIARKLKFQNILNLRTNLLDAVSGYLLQKGLERQDIIQTFLLADTLDHLKIDEFETFTQIAIDQLDENPAKDSTAYFLKYQLLLLLYMNKGAKKVGKSNTFLKDAINALNNYFVFDSLKALNAYKTNAKHNLDPNFFDELNKILKKYIEHCDINDPNIKIYYLINKGFNITKVKKLQKMYFKLKKSTMRSWTQLTTETQNAVFTYMMINAKYLKNLCCLNFKEELFNIHQFGVAQSIHLAFDEIDSAMFYNIVCSACDVEAFDWCKKFISENQQYLPEKERPDILLISDAYFNLSRKKYSDALQDLLQADSLNTTLNTPFKVVARVIELKCMYNLLDFDRFETCHRRFTQFLNNQNNLNENTVKRVKTFIKITIKLFKVTYEHSKSHNALLKEIKQLIKTAENLYEKPWLLEQFLRLKK